MPSGNPDKNTWESWYNAMMNFSPNFGLHVGIGENGFPTIIVLDPHNSPCKKKGGCGPTRYASSQGGSMTGYPAERLSKVHDYDPDWRTVPAGDPASTVNSRQWSQTTVIRCLDHECAQSVSSRKRAYEWDRPAYPHSGVDGEYRKLSGE